jgi:hypothetical protein
MPSRVWRAHFSERGGCTDGSEASIVHTGGLFFVNPTLAVARGRGIEAGEPEDMGKKIEWSKWGHWVKD